MQRARGDCKKINMASIQQSFYLLNASAFCKCFDGVGIPASINGRIDEKSDQESQEFINRYQVEPLYPILGPGVNHLPSIVDISCSLAI